MIVPGIDFGERFKQTVGILKSDFVKIALYYLLFIVISSASISLIGTFIFYLAMKFVNINNATGIDANSYINMGYFGIIYGIIAITTLILKIPFYISLVKNINDNFNGNEIDINGNLKYGFKNIWSIFNTYWYIFKYVMLIPALLLIAGLLVTFANIALGSTLIIISFIVFIYFAIFRGLRSFFSLIYAVSNDNYSSENFEKSITITKGNLGRIFGNIVLLYLIFWIIGIIISIFINISTPNNYGDIAKLIYDVYTTHNTIGIQDKIKDLVANMTPTNQSMMISFFKNIFHTTINTIFYIFGIVFYFLLLKRLEIYNGYDTQKDNLIEIINE